jgi:hypothetical protein
MRPPLLSRYYNDMTELESRPNLKKKKKKKKKKKNNPGDVFPNFIPI